MCVCLIQVSLLISNSFLESSVTFYKSYKLVILILAIKLRVLLVFFFFSCVYFFFLKLEVINNLLYYL